MSERITDLHIRKQAERLSRNLGVRVAAGQSDYKVYRCHVGGNADTKGNGYTIAVAGTKRELYDAMYAANNALEFMLEEHKYLLPRGLDSVGLQDYAVDNENVPPRGVTKSVDA